MSEDRVPAARGLYCSVMQLSEETGRTRETITKKITIAGLAPEGRIRGYDVYRVRDVLPLLFTTSEDGTIDPDKLEPNTRLAYYRGETEKLALAAKAKSLIPAAEVEAETARWAKLVAQHLETVPDMLERDCGLKPDQIAVVEKHLDALRTSLADVLAKADEIDPFS